MRIIGGSSGGRRLRAPRGQATRPTSDRVREAVFNILGPPPEGARVLDLYAGAGGLGFEALSRGAAVAVFVDRAEAAVRCLRANAAELAVEPRVRVVRADVGAALPRLAVASERFDWIFVDPPYASQEAERTLVALGGPQHVLLADEVVVVLEHDRRSAPPDATGVLALIDRRGYGDTCVSFYRRAAAAPDRSEVSG